MERSSTFNIADTSATFLGNSEELLRQWKVDLSDTPDEQNLPSASALIQAIYLLLGDNADNTSDREFVQNNVPPPASPKRRRQVKLADLKVGGCPTHEYTQETGPRSRLSADVNSSRKRKREVTPEAPNASRSRPDTTEAAICPRLPANDNSEPIRKRARLAETPESNNQKPRRARRRRAKPLRVTLLKRLTFIRMSRDSALCCWDDCCSRWRHRFSERGF